VAGKQVAGFWALAMFVADGVLDVRMRAADEADDALVLVNEPALEADLAELRAGDAQRVLKRAVKGRIGKGVERDGGGGLD